MLYYYYCYYKPEMTTLDTMLAAIGEHKCYISHGQINPYVVPFADFDNYDTLIYHNYDAGNLFLFKGISYVTTVVLRTIDNNHCGFDLSYFRNCDNIIVNVHMTTLEDELMKLFNENKKIAESMPITGKGRHTFANLDQELLDAKARLPKIRSMPHIFSDDHDTLIECKADTAGFAMCGMSYGINTKSVNVKIKTHHKPKNVFVIDDTNYKLLIEKLIT